MRLFLILALSAFSISASAHVLLRDIGVIGLMSHDIFAWDRKAEVNTENGRLDLSTIFDFAEGTRWEKGGNPKNEENAPVYTIAMQLVEFYKAALEVGESPLNARRMTVAEFHRMVEDSYQRMFGESFPQQALLEHPNNLEQAALRAMHDILPGRVKLYDRSFRRELVMTSFFTAKTMLNEKELNQPLKPFDGDYDSEYKAIKIPFSGVTINLKKVDGQFIEKFSPYRQTDMLAELALVGQGRKLLQETSFAFRLRDLIGKALCAENNPYMPQNRVCQ